VTWFDMRVADAGSVKAVRILEPLRRASRRARPEGPVLLLACVLALNAADTGVIGSVVGQLRHSLHIGNTQVGILTGIPALVGALTTVPVGHLADRVRRVPLLAGSIVLWSGAMVAGGLADSYLWLLVSRVALGSVTATAGPTVASLTGDLFPAGRRAAVYGRILAGEMVGTGFGLLAGGDIAAVATWRFSFWFVAAVGLVVAIAVWRWLPEPERGGGDDRDTSGLAALPFPKAIIHVLRIRTNVILIVASAIGYFFFAGLRTFALTLVQDHYGVGKLLLTALVPIVGAGVLAGVFSGGRLADRLAGRGVTAARVIVPGVAYACSALLFLPALLTSSVPLALPLLTCAGGALAAANPPLDAARLDVVQFGLWGRAESIRTILRMAGEAAAPVLFGWLSQALGSTSHSAAGLDRTFLLALIPLLANGLLLIRARRHYPQDVRSARGDGAPSPT
jgi:predicted MFS family arabinose efflux permease